jgi:hypothetical protein
MELDKRVWLIDMLALTGRRLHGGTQNSRTLITLERPAWAQSAAHLGSVLTTEARRRRREIAGQDDIDLVLHPGPLAH